MSAYLHFAEFYDALTKNVGYSRRADYLEQLSKHLGHELGLTLDLACGTGSLTAELCRRGVDIFGIDASAEMLSQAMQKSAESGLDILFLRQKMQSIDLYGTIDTCICTLDSINHLTNEKDVQSTFDRVSLFMNSGGLFIFDVNTVYKNEQVLSGNTFVYDAPQVYCVWQNSKCVNNTVRIDLDFFVPDEEGGYIRQSESFCERAYSHEEITQMLSNAGFSCEGCYGDMTLDKPKQDEQRVVYAAKKL